VREKRVDALRAASHLLAATIAAFPVLTLIYAILHIQIGISTPQTPTLDTLWAALAALACVLIAFPMVISVAEGKKWALTAGNLACLIVGIASGITAAVSLFVFIALILNVFGVKAFGAHFSGSFWLIAIVLLVVFAIAAFALVLSSLTRLRLSIVK
jgi:hypothetical protein